MPDDQPYFDLYCRGPFEFSGPTRTDWRDSLQIQFRRNATDAGAGGTKLAPGTCAWGDRPVGAEEPTSIDLRSMSADEFVGKVTRGEDAVVSLAWRIYLVTQFEREIIHLSNLLTRSDYVIVLKVRNEEGRFVAQPTRWAALEDLAGLDKDTPATRYLPLTG